MNEEIEYAEMLEIPVSTVNVVKKKNRRVRGKNQPNLKERLISRVNDRVGNDSYAEEGAYSAPASAMEQNPIYASAENAAIEDAAQNTPAPESEVNAYAYADGGERLETVLLSDEEGKTAKKRRGRFFFGRKDESVPLDEEEGGYDDGGTGVIKTKAERRSGIFLTVEFALACALCGTIFLTNVFMPTSAINTFFRSLMPAEEEQADNRIYSDFTLASVVSELSDAEITVSPAGVLSFTDECCVYPAVDGKVAEDRIVGVFRQVHAIEIDLAILRLIILEQEFGDGGFAAAAARPDEDARVPEKLAALEEGLRQLEAGFLGEAFDLADGLAVGDLGSGSLLPQIGGTYKCQKDEKAAL